MANFVRAIINRIIEHELNYTADNIVRKAKQAASFDATIVSAISRSEIQQTADGKYSVDIVIDLSKAPEARAFEYGSGIHAIQGVAQKYIIVPRNGSILRFPKSRWPKYVPGLTPVSPDKNGMFNLRKVSHPGVAAHPYMEPAIQQALKTFRSRLLSNDIKSQFAKAMFLEKE